ncbi:hypothetical protein DMB37_36110 [Nocardia sp. CS682]|nr:hypothetical protein DMB37_36110 [Nocardia sp. CS682]
MPRTSLDSSLDLIHRAAWADHEGPLPIIEGTAIRLRVEHLPSGGVNKPVWLWRSGVDANHRGARIQGRPVYFFSSSANSEPLPPLASFSFNWIDFRAFSEKNAGSPIVAAYGVVSPFCLTASSTAAAYSSWLSHISFRVSGLNSVVPHRS